MLGPGGLNQGYRLGRRPRIRVRMAGHVEGRLKGASVKGRSADNAGNARQSRGMKSTDMENRVPGDSNGTVR